MTSKEALLKIEAYLAYDGFQEELKVIARDLELLEEINKIIVDKIKEMIEDKEWGQYE